MIRKFTVGSVEEPETLDFHDKNIYSVSCGPSQVVTCSEDGTAKAIDVESNSLIGTVVRSSLPLREVQVSPDGEMVSVCGDDGQVKIVQISDILRTIDLPNHPQSVKHVSYSPLGNVIATSCTDGNVRFYSISSENPELLYMLEGVIPAVTDAGEQKSTKVFFHPQGQQFAITTKYFDIAVYTLEGWIENGRFQGHSGPINDVSWSPNGLYLASTGADSQLIIWSAKNRTVISRYQVDGILSVVWHPSANVVSFTTSKGQLYTLSAAVVSEGPLPYGKVRKVESTSYDLRPESFRRSVATVADADGGDDGDDIPEDALRKAQLDLEAELAEGVEEVDDWIVDDDGAGYVKDRDTNGHDGRLSKRRKVHGSRPSYVEPIEPFTPGSTPWRGNRRYLTMNSIGYVWTVMQDEYNTITVSFFDRGLHREYHFTDYAQYDSACMSEEACVYSTESGGMLVRFHDGFSDNWEMSFTDGIRAVAISNKVVVVCTSNGYIRLFNLFGTPLRVYRQARYPIVACTAKDNYFMTIASAMDGSLRYSVEDASNGITYQRDQCLEIPYDGKLQNIFFSQEGDPCIFDSRGELLVLLHWRDSTQAKWIPILDSKSLAEREGRRESYWPLGLREKQFMCIILKGAEFPSLPMPIFSEFEVHVPVEGTTEKAEEQYLTGRTFYELQRDKLEDEEDEQVLSSIQLELDKVLLYQLQASCKERKMNKSLDIVRMIHKDQALEAAVKIALRFDMTLLADRINNMRS